MILNVTRIKCLSRNPVFAIGPVARGIGMIGKKFNGFDAMVFDRCACVHTMFMSQKIDVIFADHENTILDLRRELPPWRPWVSCPAAWTVIELPAGTIGKTGSEKGDKIDLRAELSGEELKKIIGKDFAAAGGAVLPLAGNRK
jgi:uncharacterized membrane protein (UPF0127 family)